MIKQIGSTDMLIEIRARSDGTSLQRVFVPAGEWLAAPRAESLILSETELSWLHDCCQTSIAGLRPGVTMIDHPWHT